jgi:hypothetical protein
MLDFRKADVLDECDVYGTGSAKTAKIPIKIYVE